MASKKTAASAARAQGPAKTQEAATGDGETGSVPRPSRKSKSAEPVTAPDKSGTRRPAASGSKAVPDSLPPSTVSSNAKEVSKKIASPSGKDPSKTPAAVKSLSPHGKVAVAVARSAVEKEEIDKPAPRRSVKPKPGSLLTEEQLRRAPESDYMNDDQLAFFRDLLQRQRLEVTVRQSDIKERLNQHESFADPADRASAEEEYWLDLRLRERESLLLRKIDDALRRIRDKEYGYCEKTGEAIGIARLLARPTATVCVDIKDQDERAESQFRDR